MTEFKIAWNVLWRWNLSVDENACRESRVLIFMPVTGFIIGAVCCLLAASVQFLTAKPLLAGFLGAIAIFAFYAYGIHGRRLRALAELGNGLEMKREENGQPPLPGGVRIAQIICLGWLLAVLVAIIGLVSYSAITWLLIPPTLSATALAELNNRQTEKPAGGYGHWLTTLLLGLVIGVLLGRITLILLCLVLTWIIGSGVIRIPVAIDSRQSRNWLMISLLEGSLLWIGALAL